jgi:hypothetical protein
MSRRQVEIAVVVAGLLALLVLFALVFIELSAFL